MKPSEESEEMLNVLEKCDALGEAMQSFVFYQHHAWRSENKI